MTSDILQDDFENIEVLRTAFPFFIRENAMWKRCYSADQRSWSTADFHSNCDYKGPSLTVIRVGIYVFGGFVEQSWGGKCYIVCHICYGYIKLLLHVLLTYYMKRAVARIQYSGRRSRE